MNTIINLPYKISKGYWILRKIFYIADHEKVYIKKGLNYKEYEERPIYKSKWIKEYQYLKSCKIDEDGISFIFSDNQYLEEDVNDIEFYDDEIIILESEDEALERLKELNLDSI